MEYLKRMPILLSLGMAIVMGMFFLYNKKTLSDSFSIIIGGALVFYIIGRFISNNLTNLYLEYEERKKSEINIEEKEGNPNYMANNELINNKEESRIDFKVDGGNEESFVGLMNHINKENN